MNTASTRPNPDQRVVVVTGGGGGIGAAIATELGRRGDHVVTVDPLVSVDGTEQLPTPEQSTAGRIVAEGGSAEASNVSVTDGKAIAALFEELVDIRGRLDAVVNVAGISRPTGFAAGDEQDWLDVLGVHLDGYRNVLEAALPLMAGHGGHVLGVTSGSAWRAADAGAYSCAKRAVASLTWEVGRVAPPGVTVSAMSPIAMTRMVTAALERARADQSRSDGEPASASEDAGRSRTGGLSLGSMPTPDQLGPLAAYLVDDAASALAGQIVFAGGSEAAVLAPPRLLEAIRTNDVDAPDALVDAFSVALANAEASQATGGGTNPRFGPIFDASAEGTDTSPRRPDHEVRTVAVVSNRSELAAAIAANLQARGITADVLRPGASNGFDGAHAALEVARARLGGLDGLVVALTTPRPTCSGDGWDAVLAEHEELVELLHADAGWARAAADHAAEHGCPLRLVNVVDATTSGGRSRGQAVTQLARSSRQATGDRVSAFAIALESPDETTAAAALVGQLLTAPTAHDLVGAELVVGPGWLGLRSHPRPTGTIVYGGPDLPPWFGEVISELRS